MILDDAAALLMFLFLMLGLIFLLFVPYPKKKLYRIINIILMAFCFISSAYMFVGVTKVAKSSNIEYSDPNAVEHIIALSDNNILNGKLYYRSGYINEKQYYQYIVDLGNGEYIQNQIPSDKTRISYSDDPRVEWMVRKKSWNIFYSSEQCWKLYVPEGSINEEFNIDLN